MQDGDNDEMCEKEDENPTDCSRDYSGSEEIINESLAGALLYEFEERYLAAEDLAAGGPDPEAYEAAYPGDDREDFAKMLSVSRLLLEEGVERRRHKGLPDDQEGHEDRRGRNTE